MQLPSITLHSGKEHSLKRYHPWVFSGAIKSMDKKLDEGDTVEVYSSKKEFLGTGHFANGSIAVRLISFKKVNIDQAFWDEKIKNAFEFRKNLGLTNAVKTNVYRLIFAEGDHLPGLIIDYYNGTAVMQAHSAGMYKAQEHIINALKKTYGNELKAIYDKSFETLPQSAGLTPINQYVYEEASSFEVLEYGNTFIADWEKGQKTGFFIDQRENRKLLAEYSKGKSVLNTFCYTGGFSVYALNAGASLVHSVDISQRAMDLTDKNVALSLAPEKHTSFTADVFNFLKNPGSEYDIIILDPPAFAKSRNSSHNAVQGYKRINMEALKKIKKGGVLFTFSCSQVINRTLFHNTIMSAAIEAHRKVKILHQLSQPPDHPINIFHPEGEYLKGLVLFVE